MITSEEKDEIPRSFTYGEIDETQLANVAY